MKKNDEAVALINAILNKADPEDTGNMARAYNILGTALRNKERRKKLLWRFCTSICFILPRPTHMPRHCIIWPNFGHLRINPDRAAGLIFGATR